MSEDLRHECGVAALCWLDKPAGPDGPASRLVRNGDVVPLVPGVLLDLQNRGQLAAGISSYQPARPRLIQTYRDIGTVAEAFRMSRPAEHLALLDRLGGRAAIGHTRYATCGVESVSHAQPFERQHGRRWKWFSFAFNGQLANFNVLKQALLAKQHYHFSLNTDTEIIMHQLSFRLRGDRRPDLVAVMKSLGRLFDGAYNLVFLDAMGDMFVARDPLGFRPLCYGVQGRLFAAASESVALANLGFSDIRHLEPGTMAVIRSGRLRFERFARPRRRAHCFFEWVYFANVGSVIDGTSVYVSRSRGGQRLAEQEDQPVGDDCIVVPVPDTAKAAADAFAYRLGIPSVEGLIRNRYVGRTFILGRDTRVVSARRKYTPLPAVLGGKRVFLVEDSIVRSTTLAALADQIRHRGGAREIHVRVACPPIISPCFYGIDMSTLGELFAPPYLPPGYRGTLDKKTAARMAKKLGVDSLRYLAVDDLPRCIRPSTGSGRHQPSRGRAELWHRFPTCAVQAAGHRLKTCATRLGGLCTGCVLGHYPTDWGNKLLARAKRKYRHGTDDARTYE